MQSEIKEFILHHQEDYYVPGTPILLEGKLLENENEKCQNALIRQLAQKAHANFCKQDSEHCGWEWEESMYKNNSDMLWLSAHKNWYMKIKQAIEKYGLEIVQETIENDNAK